MQVRTGCVLEGRFWREQGTAFLRDHRRPLAGLEERIDRLMKGDAPHWGLRCRERPARTLRSRRRHHPTSHPRRSRICLHRRQVWPSREQGSRRRRGRRRRRRRRLECRSGLRGGYSVSRAVTGRKPGGIRSLLWPRAHLQNRSPRGTGNGPPWCRGFPNRGIGKYGLQMARRLQESCFLLKDLASRAAVGQVGWLKGTKMLNDEAAHLLRVPARWHYYAYAAQ